MKKCERCGNAIFGSDTFCSKCSEVLEIFLWHKDMKHSGDIEECNECLEMFLCNENLDLLGHEQNIPYKERIFKSCSQWEVKTTECPICGNGLTETNINGKTSISFCDCCHYDGRNEVDFDVDNLLYTCPECGGHKLVSVETNVTVYMPVSRIRADGNLDLDYDNKEDSDTVTENNLSFECESCGSKAFDSDGYEIHSNRELALAIIRDYFTKQYLKRN